MSPRHESTLKARQEELAAVHEKKRQLEKDTEARLQAPHQDVITRWEEIKEEAEAAKKAILEAHKAEGNACRAAEWQISDRLSEYRNQLYIWERAQTKWVEDKYAPLLVQASTEDMQEAINKFLATRKGKPLVLPAKWGKRRWNKVFQNGLLLEVSLRRATRYYGQQEEGSASVSITPSREKRDKNYHWAVNYDRMGPAIHGRGRHLKDALREAEETGIRLGLFAREK